MNGATTEDGRLATLVRDMLGAQGAHNIMVGLLDSLTPERRAALAEEIIAVHTFDNELRDAFAEVLAEQMKLLATEASDRIVAVLRDVAVLRERQPAIEAKIVDEMTEKVRTLVKEMVSNNLRLTRW